MPQANPNRPGYYMDGTPIQGYTASQPAQSGYPIGTNISSSPTPDPAVTQRAMDIRAASGDTPAIQAAGNPYNAQGGKVSYITADNKPSGSPKGAFTYYGVPTLASRTGMAQQNLEENKFKAQLEQWAKEFEESKRQNSFNNGISAGSLTGYYGGSQVSVPKAGSCTSPTGSYYVNGVLQ